MGIGNTLRCINCGEAVLFDPEVDLQMTKCEECELTSFTIPYDNGQENHKLVGSEGVFRFAKETHRDRESLLKIIDRYQAVVTWASRRLQRVDNLRFARKVGNVLDQLPYIADLESKSTTSYDFIKKTLSNVHSYVEMDRECQPDPIEED